MVWSDTDVGVVLSQNKTTTKYNRKPFKQSQMSKNCNSSSSCVKQTVRVGLSDEVSVALVALMSWVVLGQNVYKQWL